MEDMEIQDSYYSILEAPSDILSIIVSFLDSKEFLAITRSCKCLNQLTKKNMHWYLLCRRHWDIQCNFMEQLDWRSYFAEKTFLKERILKFTQETEDNFAESRYRHTAVAQKGIVYIIGGTGNSSTQIFGDVFSIRQKRQEDPDNTLCVVLAPSSLNEKSIILTHQPLNFEAKPTSWKSTRQVCVTAKDKLWIFGGSYNVPAIKLNDLIMIDVNDQEWKVVTEFHGNPPCPRSDHAAVSIDNKIYIFGGSSDQTLPLNDLHIFDTDTMTWSQPVIKGSCPYPRSGHGFVAIGKKAFVFGGGQWKPDNYAWSNMSNEIFMLDTEKMEWTKILQRGHLPPSKPIFPSILPIGRHILYIPKTTSKEKIYLFDTVSNLWSLTKGSCEFTPRDCISLSYLSQDKILMFGGFDQNSFRKISVIELPWINIMKQYKLSL